ncbi:Crp/Fnr family transcriptional regulator [Rhodobacter sp. M37P]|uniref:Crp/Fnr family transcriptional regulator n=2 Tax=Rhodobacter calidifons TaxID=2715277 RepID=A0ABX0G406_9RHOB|nr:Crp/Fnr family transcriptional regulator [Rhodobacter calidifons]
MQMTDCAACPLQKRRMFLPFTPEEIAFMRAFKTGEAVVRPGETLLAQGERSERLYTVLEGFATRSIQLEDGRRQVVNFVFPGDFLGLQAGIMGEMRHSVQATTPMRVCIFQRSRLWDLFRDKPDRAYDLTWLAAVEEHFLGETIATLGQRDATERVAWALARIWQRLSALGEITPDGVALPFRQHELADALGLSKVHTSRTVSQLRALGLLVWRRGRLNMPDPARLFALAGLPMEREEQRPLI